MNQVLLVEGNDDKHVLWAICKKNSIKESFSIEETKGVENLISSIPTYIKSDLGTIGILVDADFDIKSRWESLRTILLERDYAVPHELNTNGVIIHHEEFPTIGIWIMPNNTESGMIEDFVGILIPNDDKILPFADATLDKLEKIGLNNYKPIHKSKARIHTWLAWQEDPGTPMGLAITKSYLDTNQELCNLFVNWLNNLFNSENKD